MTPNSFLKLFAMSAAALSPYALSAAASDYENIPFVDIEWLNTGTGTGGWDDPSYWRIVDRRNYSTSTLVSGIAPDSTSRIGLDKSYTMTQDRAASAIMGNYSIAAATLDMGGNSLSLNVLYGNDVVNLRTNLSATTGKNGELNFTNGNINITKTATKTKNMVSNVWDGTWTTVAKDVGTNTVNIGLTENSATSSYTKTVNFSSTTNVTSTENISITGLAGSQSIVNIDGTFNAIYSGARKSVSLSNSTLNIGSTSTVNIGALSLSGTSVVNVNGALSVAPSITSGSNISVGAGSVLNINHEMTLKAASSTSNMSINGIVNLNGAGKLLTTGGYGNVNVYSGGVLRLNSGVGSFSAPSSIRLSGGGRVIFDAPDVWKDAGDGTNPRTFALWMSSASKAADVKMSYIDVNAHTQFGCMFFGTNSATSYGAQLTITFGDAAEAMLDLDKFTNVVDTNLGYLWNTDSRLVLVNFSNGKIRLKNNLRAATGEYYDNLDLISAEGFEDGSFRVEDGGDGYFYLVGTAIPEPATIALILGVVALSFAAWRRRK